MSKCINRSHKYILFVHPVLFSNFVNASLVETLSGGEQTSSVMMAAIVVQTVQIGRAHV